ncbi:hypothetical protein EWE75_20880 [Sphingomonas populi]|uniref:Uncharacterized protein n=1 Tax=Sphingomonas populi TaxID=2484750 RepID=A0A4Q6XVX7_9SPHN|nr:hypothetical protein [Sphingomonas populi]RZF60867.1 hypothetical protein EWE75_20880 [Sphingomonas populi]
MKKADTAQSNKIAQALLEKYECPVPYHEVRTRFLGNIATPAISASPLQIIKALWGGELPPFDSIEEVNELLDALVQGLWNDLTRHQKRSQPFRLTRMATESTAADLGRYGLVRLQELDGFIEGLFNGEEVIDLPERAHEAVDRLAEMRAMMAGICELVLRDPHADDRTQLDTTFRHLRELTRIMETEVHEAVLSCTRARRQMVDGILTEKPTVH